MTDSRWDRVQALFDQALAQPAEQRRTYLEACCGDDAALTEEVWSLLEADDEGLPLLDQTEAGGVQLPLDPASPYAAAPEPDLAKGSPLGEYEIDEKIGAGSFGSVYRAHHKIINKRVAIKILHRQHAASAEFAQRFVNEARAVNEIEHPNIIDIFGFSKTADGRLYYVMEYMDAPSLADVLAGQKRLSTPEALPILRGLANALDAAHQCGVVHRDLKPANVIVTKDALGAWVPKLVDFGIAKLADRGHAAPGLTGTGNPIGTPTYMAPEQIRGEAIDGRTDVYAFGVLAYRILTGQLPFPATTAFDAMMAHTSIEARAPSALVPELGPAVDAAVLAMLAKAPEARPATAGAAVRGLERANAAQPAHPRRPRRSPWLFPAGAAAATAAVAGLLWLSAHRSGDAPAPTDPAPAAPSEPTPTPTPTPTPVPSSPVAANQPAPAAPSAVVNLRVEGSPAGMAVRDEHGKAVGHAPGTLQLPRSGLPVELTFEHDGYATQRRAVDASADAVLEVQLVAKPQQRRRSVSHNKASLNPELESPFQP